MTTFVALLSDIMKEKADAIVNPANPQLAHGGGLCGIIYNAILNSDSERKNYRKFMKEINSLPLVNGHYVRCNTGQVVVTNAPGLKFQSIIHTVGPVASEHPNKDTQLSLLMQCYFNCFAVAADLGYETLSVPLISAGIYGCSKEVVVAAFKAAINTFNDTNHSITLKTVKVIVIEKEDLEFF